MIKSIDINDPTITIEKGGTITSICPKFPIGSLEESGTIKLNGTIRLPENMVDFN